MLGRSARTSSGRALAASTMHRRFIDSSIIRSSVTGRRLTRRSTQARVGGADQIQAPGIGTWFKALTPIRPIGPRLLACPVPTGYVAVFSKVSDGRRIRQFTPPFEGRALRCPRATYSHRYRGATRRGWISHRDTDRKPRYRAIHCIAAPGHLARSQVAFNGKVGNTVSCAIRSPTSETCVDV